MTSEFDHTTTTHMQIFFENTTSIQLMLLITTAQVHIVIHK